MVYDPVEQAMRDGITSIPVKARQLTDIILNQPFRAYFIMKVKAPLQKAIIFFSKKYPMATRANIGTGNTHILLSIFERFHTYNRARRNLFEAVARIGLAEYEHDRFYRDRFQFILEEIIKSILDGDWKPREEGSPKSNLWKEPTPYGGKNSIIYKLNLYGEEIKALINIEERIKD